MTPEELQTIVTTVLASLRTNSKTIPQLTEVTQMSDNDYIELGGGRKVSFANFMAVLNDYVTEDTMIEYDTTLAKLGSTKKTLDWRHSPIVLLDSMGVTLDKVNGDDDYSYTPQTGDLYTGSSGGHIFIMEKLEHGGTGERALEHVLYINKHTLRMYLYNHDDDEFTELTTDYLDNIGISKMDQTSVASVPIGKTHYLPSMHRLVYRKDANTTYTWTPRENLIYVDLTTARLMRWGSNSWQRAGYVVNDLTTGGEGDPLSAEQGKIIKNAINTLLYSLGNYAFPNGRPTINWGGGDTPTQTATITQTLTNHATSSNDATEIEIGGSFVTTLGIASGYNLFVLDDDNVHVTMNGTDITSSAFNASTGVISIATVTGNIVIEAAGMTYVDVDGSDNKLAFNLDCKNPGSNTGFWTDLIGGNKFKLTDVTISDSGAVFNGTTSKGVVMDGTDPTQEAVGTQKLDVAFDAGTIEVIATADSLPTRNNSVDCPLFLNPYGIIARLMHNTYITDRDQVIIKIKSATSGSTGGHYAVLYTGNTDIAVSLNTEDNSGGLVRYNGVTQQNPTWLDTWIGSPQNTKFSIGYFSGIQGGQALTTYFKGTIKAIRVYKVKLTEAQMAANYKVDKKRFNLS